MKRDLLTPRERQVVKLWAEGFTTIEAATVLGISGHTARTHAFRALNALGVHKQAHAVAVALRHGLIE